MSGWKIIRQSKDGDVVDEGDATFYTKKIATQVAGEMNHHDPTFIYKVKPTERKRQEKVRA
jgi:hypothetical protein